MDVVREEENAKPHLKAVCKWYQAKPYAHVWRICRTIIVVHACSPFFRPVIVWRKRTTTCHDVCCRPRARLSCCCSTKKYKTCAELLTDVIGSSVLLKKSYVIKITASPLLVFHFGLFLTFYLYIMNSTAGKRSRLLFKETDCDYPVDTKKRRTETRKRKDLTAGRPQPIKHNGNQCGVFFSFNTSNFFFGLAKTHSSTFAKVSRL